MDAETSEVVTIVVKSPYQNFPDQTISCPIEWSVHQLKEEITHTCPTHPSIKEQKLIYWGKLLEDKAQLRDTLKIYEEGQSNHTVHLILKHDQSHTKAEGLRRRAVNSPPAPSQASASQSLPTPPDPRLFPNMWGPAYFNPGPAQFNPGHFNTVFTSQSPNMSNMQFNVQNNSEYSQQVSAMQQAYVQYMQQYMQVMMGGTLPPGTPHPFLQATPPPPQPHNGPPNINNPDNAADERPRDWLDWFYLSSRALIFLTVVCFYSSPFRFLLVLVIGFAIYLYQSGFFRYPGPAILIGEQPVPANPRAGPAAPTNEPADPANSESSEARSGNTGPSTSEERSADEENGQSTTPAGRDGAVPTQRENSNQREHSQSTISGAGEDQPTLLGLTWSIVANFFASLLPEQTGIM